MLLVKKSIKSEPREDLESKNKNHNEIIVIEVEPSRDNKIAVVVAYRSQTDPYHLFLENLETALTNCLKAKLTNILLIGDFNYSDIKWDTNLDTQLPPHCHKFINMTARFGLTQLNHNPSRRENNNILDLILTNIPNKISPIYSDIFTYTSDHFLLHFDLNTTVDTLINPPRKVLNFNRGNYAQLKADINNGNLLTNLAINTCINNKLTAWSNELVKIIYNNIPLVTIKRGHSQPWIDHEALKAHS